MESEVSWQDLLRQEFRDVFESELLDEICSLGQGKSVEEGRTIVDYGQIVKFMPLVLKGLIKVMRRDEEGRELLLYFVHPGETCAMTFTCCMQQHPSEVRAEAEEAVVYVALPVALMDDWLVRYPTWKSFVMKTIRRRFHELLHALDEVAFHHLDQRLESYLRMRSEQSGSRLINLSHEEIARELASSRVVISRLLKKMENEGRLLLYRNQIKLLSKF
ncbi:MAG: Crp/Fnr family transcriptional regulator [Flavobacteriales bacterium]|nr:Crp/Fnr family transcriptional regulator [Flavobacteriales bacterium]MCX7768937.1 Crp/Fnr family transcriptional regulator [Flavobacteriales bacterium]MDW8409978.1 Crp/Fnr family transcriptional regulator [Flavobacteriales bacterium]